VLDALLAGQMEAAVDLAIESHPRLAVIISAFDSGQAKAYAATQV
jgi:hypothetical protein